MKEYNIGLDIGTNSVGWAVVECDTQKIIKKGKTPMWGVRLFSSADTAEQRRKQRSIRRRYNRRKYRIKLLREIFENEINKVDPLFFRKMDDSFYSPKDRENTFFKWTKEDKKFFKDTDTLLKGQTIYHIRQSLINNKEKADIRHIYLALHHMIKYRGHFNVGTETFDIDKLSLRDKLADFFEYVFENCSNVFISETDIIEIDYDELEKALLNPLKNDLKVESSKILKDIFDSRFISEFQKAVLGYKFDVFKMIQEESVEFKESINLSQSNLDEKLIEIEKESSVAIQIIELLKSIKDIKFIKEIFKEEKTAYISELMVKKYEQHKKDLRLLKVLFNTGKSNGKNTKLYNKYFRNSKNLDSYKNGCDYTKYLHNEIEPSVFYKKILADIKSLNIDENEIQDFLLRLENEDILPRINSTDNSAFPYQLNEIEMNKIIENQGKYYPFLLEKYDSNTYKIVRILKFKIPYYVGPLTSEDKSNFAWLVRNNDEKINPFNFESVIDKEETAEAFIKRMLRNCTYLFNEKCLPNNSILYSEFKVLNELKQISVNDTRFDNDTVQKIYKELFLKKRNITDKLFRDYLKSSNLIPMFNGDENIKGYSGAKGFANDMSSYIDFFGEKGFLKNTSYDMDIESAERIIMYSTIFEDREIFYSKIKKEFSDLEDSTIKQIIAKKYNGWGNLSKKLITYKYYPKGDNVENQYSIIDLMRTTNKNFMQILNNDEYDFQNFIKENNNEQTEKINYSTIDNLATSPANKKGIWQAIQIVKEIVNIMNKEPKYISIEMARSSEIIKKRKDSKRDYLLKLYENIEELNEQLYELYNDLKQNDPFVNKSDSQVERLYLYYIQGGKCMYSGEELELSKLMDSTEYEVDHILPQSLIKDNSYDNKVLVLRKYNQNKKDNLVLSSDIKIKMKNKWEYLRKVKLMSEKKYNRLTREYYSDKDIEGFINRQLVETRQICKHVANIIEHNYTNSKVIYLHADLSNEYRKSKELFKFRNLNNLHHAHDAYLAAVLGEYSKEHLKHKLTKDDFKELVFKINETLKDDGDEYNKNYGFVINSLIEPIREILNSEVYKDDKYLVADFNNMVHKTLMRNDILVTKKTEINTGAFYKESILKSGKANASLKDKFSTEIYGGYTNINCAYMILVKYGKDKKKIIGIPCEYIAKSNNNIYHPIVDNFIKSHLGLKENESYDVLLKKIPFNTIVEIDNHPMYITGYSLGKKMNELVNSVELKINAELLDKYKYIIRESNKNKSVVIEDKHNALYVESVNFIKELFQKKVKYPKYINEIKKIESTINFENINSTLELYKIINELFKIYSASSANGNLKEFNLGDRIGRTRSSITKGVLVFKSILGDKEKRINIDEL